MPIEIRQLNIRSSVADLQQELTDPTDATQRVLEQHKREILAELKTWLDARLHQQRER